MDIASQRAVLSAAPPENAGRGGIFAFGVKLTHERNEHPPLTPEQRRAKRARWRANKAARLAYEAARPTPQQV